ncbi:MAG: hypothetical protein WCE64_14485 [Bacteroidales bacterium]
MRKAILLLSVVIILCGYLYLSRPDKVVINEKGNVEGLANKGKALIQGRHFWQLQLRMAKELYSKDTAPHLPSTTDIQALYHNFREAENALNDKMKDLYTPEERMAEMYRIKADSLIRAGKWRLADKIDERTRLMETEKYKTIITAIEAKLQKEKPAP